MNKNIARFCLMLGIIIPLTDRCMNIQPSISIPTTFRLETIIKTALDKLTVSNIATTATCLAGIGLFYHAAHKWAEAPLIPTNITTEAHNKDIRTSRMKSALRFFIGGCVFAAAGLLYNYRNEISYCIKSLIKHKS